MDGTYVIREKPKAKFEPLKKNPEKKIKLDQSNQKNVVQNNKQINKVFFYILLVFHFHFRIRLFQTTFFFARICLQTLVLKG